MKHGELPADMWHGVCGRIARAGEAPLRESAGQHRGKHSKTARRLTLAPWPKASPTKSNTNSKLEKKLNFNEIPVNTL